MPFTQVVKVPLITAATRNAIDQLFPGVLTVSTVPVIEDEKTAVALATKMAEQSLIKYEYVSKVLSVEDTPEGWTVSFRIAGD